MKFINFESLKKSLRAELPFLSAELKLEERAYQRFYFVIPLYFVIGSIPQLSSFSYSGTSLTTSSRCAALVYRQLLFLFLC